MKKFKKLLAILLVASMIFTTNAVNVFAEGNKANQEEQLNEETTVGAEEESVGAKLGESEEEAEETTVGANEESVGAKLGEPEEDIDMDENLSEPEDDTRKGERLSEPALEEEPEAEAEAEAEEEAEETTVGANEESVGANVHGARPEDEENSTESKLGEPEAESTEEIELELDKKKKDDILYGDDPKNFYVLYYASDADYASGTVREYHVSASASLDELDYFTGDFFDSLGNLSPVMPWGFYKIGDGSTEFDLDDAKSSYDSSGTSAAFIYNRSMLEEDGYDVWKDAGAANDIYYGVLYEVRPYMYWINGYDEEDVPTIYYYATEESGGTPVVIGTNGVEYNGLDSLVKQNIKKAVFVDDIIASDVRSYFAGFSGLESITGLSKLDTSKATSFANMFNNCSTIEKIDVSSLKTNSLTDTSYMFNDCRKVQTITFGNNFDTSKVTDMSYMFSTCNKLTTINFGNKFDTSNVTNMAGMFTAVGAETLDLAKFDTSKVTNMYGMFAQCLQLKTINVSDDFKVEQVNEGDYMFVDCSNLVGGKGTIYDDTSAPWGKTYAHIDEGDANPGFFTGAPTPKPTPTPTPSPSNSGSSSGGSDGGGASDPTHGPMGDLTKNPLYANALNNIAVNTTNDIPQSSLLNNQTLYIQLTAYPENTNVQKTNAADVYGHRGYGHWQRIPNTTTWYFYAGEFNNFTNNAGYLKDGWFNLGWDGQDKWYHFDANGVMQLGWYQEAGKTYFLQNDFNDNWYGKAVTGTQNIGGRVYNFDANGALIN